MNNETEDNGKLNDLSDIDKAFSEFADIFASEKAKTNDYSCEKEKTEDRTEKNYNQYKVYEYLLEYRILPWFIEYRVRAETEIKSQENLIRELRTNIEEKKREIKTLKDKRDDFLLIILLIIFVIVLICSNCIEHDISVADILEVLN